MLVGVAVGFELAHELQRIRATGDPPIENRPEDE
jgi:hypothetical protein